MFHILSLSILFVVGAVALLAMREARQHSERIAQLRPGAPRDGVRRARNELRSRVRDGAGSDAGGRTVRASDLLHWGAFLAFAAPFLIYWQAIDAYQRAWVMLAWLPLPIVAWWLTMRRDGVRNAHRLPLAAWTVAYVVLVATFTFQDHAIRSSLADYFSRFSYMTDARVAMLTDKELNPFFSTAVSSAVLTLAAATIVGAVATMGMRASRLIDSALIGAAAAAGIVAWTSNQHGVVVVVIGTAIVGYAIARAIRIDRETEQCRRALAVLDAGGSETGSAGTNSPATVAAAKPGP